MRVAYEQGEGDADPGDPSAEPTGCDDERGGGLGTAIISLGGREQALTDRQIGSGERCEKNRTYNYPNVEVEKEDEG